MRSTKCIIIILLIIYDEILTHDDIGYMKNIKDGCFNNGEALSCLKYKAIKEVTKSFIGDLNTNDTLKANSIISLVPLSDDNQIEQLPFNDHFIKDSSRGLISEWSQLTMYWIKVLSDFLRGRGMRVLLPPGARSYEVDEFLSEDVEEGRGKRKRLAIILPLLSLMAALKTKILIVPILLGVLFIKKLLLAAALLIPSLLNTLKACKLHQPHHSFHFGSSDTATDFSSSAYNNGYGYSAGSSYGKDWAASRAYQKPKPVYIMPGSVVA